MCRNVAGRRVSTHHIGDPGLFVNLQGAALLQVHDLDAQRRAEVGKEGADRNAVPLLVQ
jgi:hypothetical protein